MSEPVRHFLSDWWRSRDWSLFRLGLFAMLGGLGLMVLLLFAELQSSWDRSGQYLGAARHARAKGDLESATIYYEKALVEREDDAAALFEWMMVFDELGEQSSRDATLRYLADEVGYPPALFYSGRLALREGRVDDAGDILESSLEKIPVEDRGQGSVLAARADEIRRGLMRGHWNAGAFREAIEEGNRLIDPVFRDEMDLAVLHLRAGDLQAAKQKAARLRDRLGMQGEKPNVDLFSALAEAVMGNGAAVMTRLDRASRRDAAGRAVVEARVRCFELLRISMQDVPDLRLLEPLALAGSTLVVGPLVDLVSEGAFTDGDLVKVMVGGQVPLVGHLLARLCALRDGKEDEARLHFGMANELSTVGGSLLGWCGVRLARLEGHDREALFLTEMVTSLIPGPDGIFIKGKILLEMGQWEAVEMLMKDETLTTEMKAELQEALEVGRATGRKAKIR